MGAMANMKNWGKLVVAVLGTVGVAFSPGLTAAFGLVPLNAITMQLLLSSYLKEPPHMVLQIPAPFLYICKKLQ